MLLNGETCVKIRIMSKRVFFSGVQPSGKPHIGNYFGAMKQFVDLQSEYGGYVAIVDYHALHTLQNPKEMREKIVAGEIDVGTFNYPMLMAADILLYDTDLVPVGADQKQHVEIARDTAEKFNRTFGQTFKIPEPMIMKDVAVVPGTDGRKMSKSYGNTIPLFAEYK